MRRNLNGLLTAGLFLLGSVPLAAIADTTGNPDTNTPPATIPSMPETESATVSTSEGNLGDFLTDSAGKSLYVLDMDSQNMSNCTGQCAQVWMPMTISRGQNANASGHVNKTLLGTFERSDGTTQVTYNGMPLYYYKMDEEAGETRGQGVNDSWGTWFLVKPDGTKLVPPMNASTPSGTTGNPGENQPSGSTGSSGGSTGGSTGSPGGSQPSGPTGSTGSSGGNQPTGSSGSTGSYVSEAQSSLSFLDEGLSPRSYDYYRRGHGNRDCYYWGTCYGRGHGYSCGYYTCYYNGYCCDYCGHCYRRW